MFLITYVLVTQTSNLSDTVNQTSSNMSSSFSQLGLMGSILLIFRAYSMGAGTYTGIEAVSNGITNLREPRVRTASRTMKLLALSLSTAVLGLIISYYLMDVKLEPHRTLNAVLIHSTTTGWPSLLGKPFILITLLSEAALLFVAAQTGFLDGPRVMANMASDSWLPRRFTLLNDRLVSQNGILLMGTAAFIVLYLSKGSVTFLVILYSINVFITFTISQFGMVRHWYTERRREKKWFRKMIINGIGLILTSFILITVIILKFDDGGWITLVITGMVVLLAIIIKRHYIKVTKNMQKIQRRINENISVLTTNFKTSLMKSYESEKDTINQSTAVLLVNGYNGIGIYTLFKVISLFPTTYKNFIFVHIGVIDSNSLKKSEYIERINEHFRYELKKYEYLTKHLGYNADSMFTAGTDVAAEVEKMIPEIIRKYPKSTFIGSQLIFDGVQQLTKILHNYTIFAIQQRLFKHGLSTIVLPVSFENMDEFLKEKSLVV
jgi:hypothetical protein